MTIYKNQQPITGHKYTSPHRISAVLVLLTINNYNRHAL